MITSCGAQPLLEVMNSNPGSITSNGVHCAIAFCEGAIQPKSVMVKNSIRRNANIKKSPFDLNFKSLQLQNCHYLVIFSILSMIQIAIHTFFKVGVSIKLIGKMNFDGLLQF
ncbi:MAG TPA: hypothetical protein DDY13_18620 [Cytophagales bacterium]|jgi:hypothetical protein|nr:hypothetical protein [Cytophagales bacterium]